MNNYKRAAFTSEDTADAKYGEPSFDLSGYAASRDLRFIGREAPPNFSHACPSHPEYCFNSMDGVLPGGAFGMLQNQLKEIPVD